jgi:F-type H+-transporting ATPase subunit delta
MSVNRIASRYAKSLIELAAEQNNLEKIHEDVAHLRRMINSSKELLSFLRSPVIQYSRKKKALEALLKDKFQDLTFNFVDLLAAKKREAYLPEIADEFIIQYRTLNKISQATIITAGEITPELETKIKEKLQEATIGYRNVEIISKVDPALIGGFVIEFEGHVYDVSVKYELEQMRKEFKGNLFESAIGR